MKTTLHTAIAAAAVAALSTLAAGSAFAQVTAPGAGTTSTPALRSVPPHVDKPGDHPRGPAEVQPNVTTGTGAGTAQTPSNTPLPPHVDKPGDHPRGANGHPPPEQLPEKCRLPARSSVVRPASQA